LGAAVQLVAHTHEADVVQRVDRRGEPGRPEKAPFGRASDLEHRGRDVLGRGAPAPAARATGAARPSGTAGAGLAARAARAGRGAGTTRAGAARPVLAATSGGGSGAALTARRARGGRRG